MRAAIGASLSVRRRASAPRRRNAPYAFAPAAHWQREELGSVRAFVVFVMTLLALRIWIIVPGIISFGMGAKDTLAGARGRCSTLVK